MRGGTCDIDNDTPIRLIGKKKSLRDHTGRTKQSHQPLFSRARARALAVYRSQSTFTPCMLTCAGCIDKPHASHFFFGSQVLEMKPDRQQVFVTNAHLTWDPAFKDVKVIQSVMLLHEVEKVIAEHKKEGTKPAVIVGGDFNSTPDSGVLEFMTRSKISQQHPDLIGRDYKKFAENTGLAHKLNLRSCYNKEMPYTNYTHDFTGIIDYIFYSADTVVPSVVLGPADPATMGSFDGCPNPHFPSDHFSIAAQLSLATRD